MAAQPEPRGTQLCPGEAQAGRLPQWTGEDLVSVVLPAYNEAAFIQPALETLLRYAQGRGPMEILVVDDGSADETVARAARVAASHPEIRILRQGANRGKGAAVRRGMLRARGRIVCFCDVILSLPISSLDEMVTRLTEGSDIVIASRAWPASGHGARGNLVRRAMGSVFNLVVRALMGLRFRDTQCGLKAFRREAARAIFSRARIDGFAFDVEVLLLAARLGFSVAEVPVRWVPSRPSKVNLLSHPVQMLAELWGIRRALRNMEEALRQPLTPHGDTRGVATVHGSAQPGDPTGRHE